MFESHFGLRENPFVSGHQPRFVYPSPEHQEALAHLRYGIENLEPFVLITGEVGTGKTTAIFEALGELQARVSVALITNSALTRGELLEEICLRFGITLPQPITKPQAMAQFERHLLALRGRGERAILLIDEAQNFDRELLEEVRLLSNLEASGEKLLQIFLVGQPELEMRLSAPELRQLRQRVAVHYRLRPLGREETAHYIHHRVGAAGGDPLRLFPVDTCAEVHTVTNGIPREINQICAQAMIDAFVDGSPSVTLAHIRAAAVETSFQSVLPAAETDPRLPPPLPAWPAAVAPRAPEPPAAATAPMPAPPPLPVAEPEPVVPEPVAPPPPPPAPPEPELVPEPVAQVEPQPAPEPVAEAAPLAMPEPAAPIATPEPETIIPAAAPLGAGPVPDAQATRWEAWVASLVKQSEAELAAARQAGAEVPPPAPETPESVAESAPQPEAEPQAAPEPPAPIRTRYAAESAVEPLPAESPSTRADWRPPRWSPTGDDEAGAEEGEGKTGGLMLRVLVGVAVVAVVGITAVLLYRFGPWQQQSTTVPAAVAPAEQVVPSPTADSTQTTMPDTARTDSVSATVPAAPAAAPPPQAAVLPPVGAAPATAPPSTGTAPATRLEFGIAVGTYLDRARAQTEVARLNAAGIPAVRIAAVPSEGVTMHAVVVGAYASRAAAEREANALIERGLVDEARIISRTLAARP